MYLNITANNIWIMCVCDLCVSFTSYLVDNVVFIGHRNPLPYRRLLFYLTDVFVYFKYFSCIMLNTYNNQLPIYIVDRFIDNVICGCRFN